MTNNGMIGQTKFISLPSSQQTYSKHMQNQSKTLFQLRGTYQIDSGLFYLISRDEHTIYLLLFFRDLTQLVDCWPSHVLVVPILV